MVYSVVPEQLQGLYSKSFDEILVANFYNVRILDIIDSLCPILNRLLEHHRVY